MFLFSGLLDQDLRFNKTYKSKCEVLDNHGSLEDGTNVKETIADEQQWLRTQ